MSIARATSYRDVVLSFARYAARADRPLRGAFPPVIATILLSSTSSRSRALDRELVDFAERIDRAATGQLPRYTYEYLLVTAHRRRAEACDCDRLTSRVGRARCARLRRGGWSWSNSRIRARDSGHLSCLAASRIGAGGRLGHRRRPTPPRHRRGDTRAPTRPARPCAARMKLEHADDDRHSTKPPLRAGARRSSMPTSSTLPGTTTCDVRVP